MKATGDRDAYLERKRLERAASPPRRGRAAERSRQLAFAYCPPSRPKPTSADRPAVLYTAARILPDRGELGRPITLQEAKRACQDTVTERLVWRTVGACMWRAQAGTSTFLVTEVTPHWPA